MLTRIAVAGWTPLWVVAGRLSLAAFLLVIALRALRLPWPRGGASWGFFLLAALVGNVTPFLLITWGQTRVPAGATAILLGITPLATLLLARLFLADERFDLRRTVGFLCGFAGILLLVGPDAVAELLGAETALAAELAILAGGLCYASGTIIARLRPAEVEDATAAAAGTILVAALMSLALALAAEPPPAPAPQGSTFAVLALGVLGTALPTVCFFRLVSLAGAAFTSLINYLIPIWGVLLATVTLAEPLEWRMLAALALVLGGILLGERRSG